MAYQPLTPAVFHVLLALADGDKHGYAIMKSVEEHTARHAQDGSRHAVRHAAAPHRRRLGAGGHAAAGLSVRDERRRFYRLTGEGRQALGAEVRRLEDLVRLARRSRGVPKAARR